MLERNAHQLRVVGLVHWEDNDGEHDTGVRGSVTERTLAQVADGFLVVLGEGHGRVGQFAGVFHDVTQRLAAVANPWAPADHSDEVGGGGIHDGGGWMDGEPLSRTFQVSRTFRWMMANLSGKGSVDDLICLLGALDGQMTWVGRGRRELFKSREPFDGWKANLSGKGSVDDLVCLLGALDGQMTWVGRGRRELLIRVNVRGAMIVDVTGGRADVAFGNAEAWCFPVAGK